MIKAKPVIPDQYWILRDDEGKIGNIESDGSGYTVSIKGSQARYQTLSMLTQRVPIAFEEISCTEPKKETNEAYGYPTTGTAYNAMFDVKHQLPLWTTEPNSRSWLAAGWYRVKQHRDWKVMQCPKLIMLDRYEFRGPFKTANEARGS